MNAEEKKYVYPEVEQDYEEYEEEAASNNVNYGYETPTEHKNDGGDFHLIDLKDSESTPFEEYKEALREETYHEDYYEDGKWVNKWVSFLLCFFLGGVGAHKFYEGRIGMGLLYIFTGGLFGIGVFVDLIKILLKDEEYYVPRE